MRIRATKDLYMMEGDNSKVFTKGREYEVLNDYLSYLHDNIKVIDDEGEVHYLGIFFTKFKIVKR